MKTKEFKVGDEVYCLKYGEGVVENINAGGAKFPVAVNFCDHTDIYTSYGYLNIADKTPMLYHSKPEIIEPKRKVTKYQVVYKCEGDYRISTSYFQDETEFIESTRDTCRFIQLIKESAKEFEE